MTSVTLDPTMKKTTRPAFLRLLMIANEIRLAGKPVSSETLAGHHLCSARTIRRDVEFLCEIGCPVFFDVHVKGWRWRLDFDLPWWLGGAMDCQPPEFPRGENWSAHADVIRAGFCRRAGISLDARRERFEAEQRAEAKRLADVAATKRYRHNFTREGFTCEGKPRQNAQHHDLRHLRKTNPKLWRRLYNQRWRAAQKESQ